MNTFQIGSIRVLHIPSSSSIHHLGFFLKAGSRYDPPKAYGIAHLWEHMMFKQTKTKSTFEVLSNLEKVGGEVSAYTTKEKIVLYASFTNPYLKQATDLLVDMLTNTVFEAEELKKEKQVIYDEIDAYEDSPQDLIHDQIEDLVFEDYPVLGHPILGTKSSLAKISIEDLKAYRRDRLTQENLVVCITGQLDLEAWKIELSDKLSLPLGAPTNTHKPMDLVTPNVAIEKQKNTQQQHWIRAHKCFSYKAPESKVIHLINNYLGGPNLTSLLNYEIREKQGIGYQVESFYNTYNDIGLWGIYLGTSANQMKQAKFTAQWIIDKLCNELISEDKLKEIKRQYIGQYLLGLDDDLNQMFYYGKKFLLQEKIISKQDWENEVESIDNSLIMRVLQKLNFEKEGFSLTYL